jgi:hypothetical protein
MQNDFHKTFGEIFNDDIAALRKQLLDVQHLQADREESEDWVSSLRFLDISHLPDLQKERQRQDRVEAANLDANLETANDPFFDRPVCTTEIPVTKRRDDDGRVDYVAVSWKWTRPPAENPYSNEDPPIFHYSIKRPGRSAHQSAFPNHYMERVVQFAQSLGITRLWIDKECIYQRPGDDESSPNDKELGVQIMDVVYGDSSASVGLLTTSLKHQHEVDILSSLLKRSLFIDPQDKDAPKLRPEVSIIAVQMLILLVLSDPRWSRGWIFQEDHLASHRMTLLIPYDESLQKGHHYDFGNIPGELQVNLAAFRQAVTMFCLACPEDGMRWPNSEILGKTKQYNIWNRRVYSNNASRSNTSPMHLWSDSADSHHGGAKLNDAKKYSNVSHYPTTTNSVLDDICNRSLEHEEDRIAILANALKFSRRLNIGHESPLIEPGRYSLSVALLTLIVINGEILMNAPWEQGHLDFPSEHNIMQHTLQSYIQSCQHLFNAPGLRLQQTFIDRCRFKPPTITPRGLVTKGFLFNLSRPSNSTRLRLTDQDREALSQTVRSRGTRNRKLDNIAHKALGMLIAKLNNMYLGSRLAAYIQHHLHLDLHPPSPTSASPTTPYVLDMLSALYQALLDDRQLCLGRLASSPPDAEPTAIFIEPAPNGWTTGDCLNPETEISTKIFTSWDSGRNAYDKERLASLEVAIFDGRHEKREWDAETCSLRSFGWVNGVWDVRGESIETYNFPLAGITPDPQSDSRKRKRGEEEFGLDARGGGNDENG